MGINCSTIAELRDNEHVKKLSGKESISENNPFWNQLSSFTFQVPSNRTEAIEMDEITEVFCKSLFENNQHTGNFASLVKLFLSRASELKSSAECDNKLFVWQSCNILFVIRHLCKFSAENMSEEKMAEQFEARSLQERKDELMSADLGSQLGSEDNNSTLRQFILALMDVIIEVPILNFTYTLHLEALSTLLVLLSIQLFTTVPLHVGVMYQSLSEKIDPDKVNSFVHSLLLNFIERRLYPQQTSKPTESIVIGLATAALSGIWSAMKLPSVTNDIIDETECQASIAELSCLLLLALAMHKSCDSAGNMVQNPYQESLSFFRHIQGPQFVRGNTKKQIKTTASFHLNLSRLYSTMCSELNSESTILLFYNLLHRNPDVRAYILSKTDIEAIVLPILKVLYSAPQQNSHHIYMALIVLLILTEDNTFNKSVHDIKISNASWYTDRLVTNSSLGDLIILVLIRTIQFNINQMRDQYLHTNCLAALANMSCHFRLLHHYAAQRIFSMISMLTTKLKKLSIRNSEQRLVEQMTPNSSTDDLTVDMSRDPMIDISIIEEITRMLLEIVNSCLTGNSLRNNATLVYALLQSRSTFEKLKDLDNFKDVLQNVETLLNFFDSRLEQLNRQTMTIEEVHDFINEAIVQIPSHRLHKYPDLKFRYIEEEHPEEFFVPYVWSLIFNHSNIFWNPGCIQLFPLD